MSSEIKSLMTQKGALPWHENVKIWIHKHPTTVKVIEAAALIIGIGVLVSLPFTAPMIGIAAVVVLAVAGSLLTLTSITALSILDIFVPPHHEMKHHAFKPGKCPGGRLYYVGDVPILSLDYSDPFLAGKAHGYLCGNAIDQLTKRFGMMVPQAGKVKKTLAELRKKIPDVYLKEMEGIVAGYKKWAKEHWWQFPRILTVDDLILFHLIADSGSFNPMWDENSRQKENSNSNELAVACTSILDKDEDNNIVFARNMDWPSLGVGGTYSLIIHRKNKPNGQQDTIEVGIPRFVGTPTGMPALLFNRSCLENCRTIADVENYIQNKSPLSAYHMSIADRTAGESIHFYQSFSSYNNPHHPHVIRRLDKKPLVTLNCTYRPEASSKEPREGVIDKFFTHRKGNSLDDALKLNLVNNWRTSHHVMMEPGKKMEVAFDNAFAGKSRLHSVPVAELFA